MRSRALMLLASLLAFALPAPTQIGPPLTEVVPLDETDRMGTLEIHFVDSHGEPIRASAAPIVTIEDAQTGSKLVRRRTGLRTLTLPYGTYWLRVQLPPAYPVDKKVVIRDPFQVVFISFTVAPIVLPWGGNTIRGKVIAGRPEDQCKWVRLLSVFSERDFSEAKAWEGKFTVHNLRPGLYLGIVTGENGVCGITSVTIRDVPLQYIELDGKN